jgi:hypothetical protein
MAAPLLRAPNESRPNRTVRPLVILLVVLCVIALATVSWNAAQSAEPLSNDDDGSGDGSVVLGKAASFNIAGDATAILTPGSVATLDLELTNTGAANLAITELTVTVRSIDAPHATNAHPCSANDFEVRQLSPDVARVLPAHSVRTLTSLGVPSTAWPAVTMLNRAANQDGCQDATLALTYAGTGTVVKK